MGAVTESEFGGLFNSPLEAGIRAVVDAPIKMRPERKSAAGQKRIHSPPRSQRAIVLASIKDEAQARDGQR
jgi:hypothetical protein